MWSGLAKCGPNSGYDSHDTILSPKDVLKKISDELLTNLEYTTFMKSPLNQYDVEYNLMEKTTRSKATCDLYLPAMANALDIHIRVIQKVGEYFAVMNTTPTRTTTKLRKRVNLVFDGEKYKPVVYISKQGKVAVVTPQPQTPRPAGAKNCTITSTPTLEGETTSPAVQIQS